RLSWNQGAVFAAVPGTAMATTDDNGRYRLRAPGGEHYLYVAPPNVAGQLQIYRYYPGTIYPEDAVPVRVQSGSDLPGVDVVLPRTESYRVAFRLPLPEYLPGASRRLRDYVDASRLFETQVLPLGRGRVKGQPYV